MKCTPTRRQGHRVQDLQKKSSFFFRREDMRFHVLMSMMNFKNISYDPNNWRLLIDSSNLSLKAVLLHNGNIRPSIPIRHSVHAMETYANVKLLLELIMYKDHKCQICGDLKVIALLMGMQLGYTKYCCFLCW
ncbi:uncharacterized protein TNCV_3297771 [Trichonephila clavipes]|uniref:Uncharacterized protein n=1 Tax=Trichonephila clavipes TaxID=2585209 RepID=A0A8X6VTG5_TRICX|nr:uncharacterized protein TNCV_3297771 [Trichonephila clavipes]